MLSVCGRGREFHLVRAAADARPHRLQEKVAAHEDARGGARVRSLELRMDNVVYLNGSVGVGGGIKSVR